MITSQVQRWALIRVPFFYYMYFDSSGASGWKRRLWHTCIATLLATQASTVGAEQLESTSYNRKTDIAPTPAYLDLAREALLRDQPDKALTMLKGHSPNSAYEGEYRFLLGRAYQELKRNIEALQEYSISIYLKPNDPKGFINRGLVKGALQDLNGAIKDLNIASSLEPSNPIIYLNRGVTQAGMNRMKEAIQDFERAIQLDPRYADAYRNRGITYNFLGDQKSACRDWSKAAELGSIEPRSWVLQMCKKR